MQRVLFCWERSNKLYVTDAENVNPKTHACFFKQYLRQVRVTQGETAHTGGTVYQGTGKLEHGAVKYRGESTSPHRAAADRAGLASDGARPETGRPRAHYPWSARKQKQWQAQRSKAQCRGGV